MAYELSGFNIPGLVAAADLSAKQYYCVKKNTTNNEAALCATDGEIVFGVLQNKPTSGEAAEVTALGVTKVTAGETLTAGDAWGTDANGKARIVDAASTGAVVGDFTAGTVIEGASAGELATVTIGLINFRD